MTRVTLIAALRVDDLFTKFEMNHTKAARQGDYDSLTSDLHDLRLRVTVVASIYRQVTRPRRNIMQWCIKSMRHVGTCGVHVVLLSRLSSTTNMNRSDQNYTADSQL
jgi:hypothetical protein